MLGYWAMDQRFWNKMNAARLEQSVCIFAAMWAGLFTYGLANAPALSDACDDGAEIIILWGNNMVSTGVHSVPFVQEAQKRGAKVLPLIRASPVPRYGGLAYSASPWHRWGASARHDEDHC